MKRSTIFGLLVFTLLGDSGPVRAQDNIAEDDYIPLKPGLTAVLTVELPESPPWPPTDRVKAFEEELPDCELTLRYIDKAGDEFTTRSGNETAIDVELQSGEEKMLVLRANAVLDPDEQGEEFRPSVWIVPQSEIDPGMPDSCQRINATLKVTEQSGNTIVDDISLTD